MLDQRRRCWADVVQMLYKCFVFAVSDVGASIHLHGSQSVTSAVEQITDRMHHFPPTGKFMNEIYTILSLFIVVNC